VGREARGERRGTEEVETEARGWRAAVHGVWRAAVHGVTELDTTE